MVNNEELIGITEYRTLYMRCRINRCRYKRFDCIYIWVCSSQKLCLLALHYYGKLPTESTNDKHIFFL